MKAVELLEYLRTLSKVRPNTVDQIVHGDPNREIVKLGLCWMPYRDTLERAAADGVNVMVVHEAPFYVHRGWESPENDVKRKCLETGCDKALAIYEEAVASKRALLDRLGLTLVRCHDALDAAQGFGVPFAFARHLGYTEHIPTTGNPYLRLYRIPEIDALTEAKRVLARMKDLGQGAAFFYGDGARRITKVGLGTGCCCDPAELLDMGSELIISITDTARTWIHGEFARDTGRPLLVVDHGASEDCGVRELRDHLAGMLDAPCVDYPQGAGFTTLING